MDINKLKETDSFGRFYLKASDKGRFEDYYYSLDMIRPLIESEAWLKNVTGFYINVAEGFAVRLSYFTTSIAQITKVVNNFVEEHNLKHTQIPESLDKIKISAGYGDEELRFRRFLSTYTLIGLDIIKADLLNARCLFATFRWQIMIARKPYKPHFINTFENDSPFYNSLSNTEKDQFWNDLAYRPTNPQETNWAHMFVNMILGGDWSLQLLWPNFPFPQPPLPIQITNKLVKEMGFQIPDTWHP